MNHRYGIALAVAGLFTAAGCGFATVDSPDNPTSPSSSETGLALTVEIDGAADVTGMRFIVETCEGQPVFSEDLELEEIAFPGDLPAFVDAGFQEDSQHPFADYFALVPAGCYNVEVQPLTDQQQPSDACSAAQGQEINVEDGRTTEIVLVTQCQTEQGGALDVIAAIDVAPALSMVEYQPSKFVQCGEELIICATADGSGGAIALDWEQTEGPDLPNGFEITSTEFDNGSFTECVALTPEEGGTYQVAISAFSADDNDNGNNDNGNNDNGNNDNGNNDNGNNDNGNNDNGNNDNGNNDNGNNDEANDLAASLTIPVHVYCPLEDDDEDENDEDDDEDENDEDDDEDDDNDEDNNDKNTNALYY